MEKSQGRVDISIQDLHKRYLVQAPWTSVLRDYFFRKIDLRVGSNILEVGCGTCAILDQIDPKYRRFGIDKDLQSTRFSRRRFPNIDLILGNGFDLPFPDRTFNLVFCHFLLLWIDDPEKLLLEMKRVTRKDGWIAAFAEPDYSGSTGKSAVIDQIRSLQIQSLKNQGANPLIGKYLQSFFSKLNLRNLESGQLDITSKKLSLKQINSEIKTIKCDLRFLSSQNQGSRQIAEFKNRMFSDPLYALVPTFFAFGQVK